MCCTLSLKSYVLTPQMGTFERQLTSACLFLSLLTVGRGGFEPPKLYSDRFTVCSLWPLGYLPNYLNKWSWRRDLNPRPADYKSAALPTELRQQNFKYIIEIRYLVKY